MLSSQMYRDAGIAGLLRASATAPVTAASPLCVPHLCCFDLQFRTILFGMLWCLERTVIAQWYLAGPVCLMSVSVLQCAAV